MSLILSGPAQRDIDGIWLHIARDSGSIEAAEKFLAKLEKKLWRIAVTPGIGTSCRSIDPEGLRAVEGNYLIYYRVSKQRVIITRVIHGMRDQRKAWKSPKDR